MRCIFNLFDIIISVWNWVNILDTISTKLEVNDILSLFAKFIVVFIAGTLINCILEAFEVRCVLAVLQYHIRLAAILGDHELHGVKCSTGSERTYYIIGLIVEDAFKLVVEFVVS